MRMTRSLVRQTYAAVTLSSFGFMFGMAASYTAVASHSWPEDPERPFDLERSDFGIHGSVVSLGSLIGAFIGGYLMHYLGNKKQILLAQIPISLSWLLLSFPINRNVVFFSRALTGCATEIHLISTQLYLADVAETRYRGRLTSLAMPLQNFGSMVCYAVGMLLDWKAQALLNAVIPCVVFVMVAYLPDAPTSLLRRGDEAASFRSLLWFRGGVPSETDKPNVASDDSIFRAASLEFIEHRDHLQASKAEDEVRIRDLSSPLYAFPLVIVFLCVALRTATGILPIWTFAVDMFKEAGSSIDSYVGAIIIGSCMLVSQVFSAATADHWGRKKPTIISLVLCALAQIAFGTYHYLKLDSRYATELSEHLSFLPLICLMIFMFGFGLGTHNIVFSVAMEIVPAKIKKQGTFLMSLTNRVFSYIVTATYYPLAEKTKMGRHGTFWMYGISAVLLLVIYVLTVPEARGISLIDIERKMSASILKNTSRVDLDKNQAFDKAEVSEKK